MARLRNPGALAGLLLIIAAFIVVIVFIIPKDERSPGILPENIPGAKELSEIKNKVVGEIKKLTGTDTEVTTPNGADAQPAGDSTGATPAPVVKDTQVEGDEATEVTDAEANPDPQAVKGTSEDEKDTSGKEENPQEESKTSDASTDTTGNDVSAKVESSGPSQVTNSNDGSSPVDTSSGDSQPKQEAKVNENPTGG
ncbi:hypothetical protein BdWA1_002151 [Babesia duncani]|nr:hypothetical protein BdWA1_002151 [Babesia duncani]